MAQVVVQFFISAFATLLFFHRALVVCLVILYAASRRNISLVSPSRLATRHQTSRRGFYRTPASGFNLASLWTRTSTSPIVFMSLSIWMPWKDIYAQLPKRIYAICWQQRIWRSSQAQGWFTLFTA